MENEQSGDSAPERVAAHNRELAENLATLDEWEAYWTKSRDTSEQQLELYDSQIKKLTGADRSNVSRLDETKIKLYEKLAQAEREQKQINQTAREMLDRIKVSGNTGDNENGHTGSKRPISRAE